MNVIVSWCRHLLVPFLFHDVTSLHSPSFHRNDFSTCSYRNLTTRFWHTKGWPGPHHSVDHDSYILPTLINTYALFVVSLKGVFEEKKVISGVAFRDHSRQSVGSHTLLRCVQVDPLLFNINCLHVCVGGGGG